MELRGDLWHWKTNCRLHDEVFSCFDIEYWLVTDTLMHGCCISCSSIALLVNIQLLFILFTGALRPFAFVVKLLHILFCYADLLC